MIISRIQVEEGFLDGLDLPFSAGLNVLIGPRGSGKTSVIELIRFCLGVVSSSDDPDLQKRADNHARSVLGSGKVSVTLSDDSGSVLVSRTGRDDGPRPHGMKLPLVFSQNEIERVGLEPAGRLRIIDGLAGLPTRKDPTTTGLEAEIRSLTVGIQDLIADIGRAQEQLEQVEVVKKDLGDAELNQQQLLATSKNATPKERELTAINTQLAQLATSESVLSAGLQAIEQTTRHVEAAQMGVTNLPSWPPTAGPEDLLAPARGAMEDSRTVLRDQALKLKHLTASIEMQIQRLGTSRAAVDDRARSLRKELELLKAGAGAATQRVASLQERLANLNAQVGLREDKVFELRSRQLRREDLVAQLEGIRDTRFHRRLDTANQLTKELGPTIKVHIERGGYSPHYVTAIQNALRGSGLHYTTLAPVLAQTLSPRELAHASETRNAKIVADLANIGLDRAQKVVDEINRTGAADILTAAIDDLVVMQLLDNTTYKATDELSTGQRCTVILSVLLGYQGRPLLIDQPEDNLDNAFIVDTLVESLSKAKKNAQLIFSTHNANIPVLGEADLVVHMGSDGKRGFKRSSGSIDDETSVKAITDVMEGGREAFERRAAFYAAHNRL